MQNPIRTQVGTRPGRLRQLGSGTAAPVPVGLTPAALQPSLPGALGPEQGQYVRLPGANYPPAGSTPVDEVGDSNIAPGGTAVLITFTIPSNLRLRLEGIGFGADDEVALRFLTWSLRVNNIAVPGYSAVPAAIGSLRQLAKMVVIQGADQTLTVVTTIAATSVFTYRYIARIQGWLYSETEA